MITIIWESAMEIGVQGFYVERRMDGGTRCDHVGPSMIPSKGRPGSHYEHVDRDVTPGVIYRYWIVAVERDGDELRFELPAVAAPAAAHRRPVLHPATPNPFESSGSIRFDLPHRTSASLRIYDVAGRAVRSLVDGNLVAGSHHVGWDRRDNHGRRLGAGVYFYRLQAGGSTLTRKLIVAP